MWVFGDRIILWKDPGIRTREGWKKFYQYDLIKKGGSEPIGRPRIRDAKEM
jgi:hypothetical protein